MTIHPTKLEPPSRIRRGVALAVPLAVVVGLFGVSFGVVAASTPDVGGLAAIVMSATTLAGSAQFAAISVLAGPADLGHPRRGAAQPALPRDRDIRRWLDAGWPLQRFLLAQLIVDESWAISARPGGRFEIRLLVGAGVLLWLAWVVGTAIGSVGGAALGDPTALGLDAAFPALFLALVVPQLRTRRAIGAAMLGAGIAVALVPVTPAGVPVIAAAAASLIGLVRR